MTLDKAIEILSDSANRGMTTFNQDFRDAENLGIEALKKWKQYRTSDESWWGNLLPGETED